MYDIYVINLCIIIVETIVIGAPDKIFTWEIKFIVISTRVWF